MQSFMDFRFIKMSGTGNTFVIIDNRKSAKAKLPDFFNEISKSRIVRRLCSSISGVAADGLVFIEDADSAEADFRWDFFNSDGSVAQMCGNASRCVARYYFDHIDNTKNDFRFETIAGLIGVSIRENIIEVRMPPVKLLSESLSLRKADGRFQNFFHVDTGVPHLVIEVEEISKSAKYLELASELRSHRGLPQEGANITFFSPLSSNKIEAITFERGVEGFTPACGTGAVAAAYKYHRSTNLNWVKVMMPGGRLDVKFPPDEAPLMSGTALYIAEFKMNAEAFDV